MVSSVNRSPRSLGSPWGSFWCKNWRSLHIWPTGKELWWEVNLDFLHLQAEMLSICLYWALLCSCVLKTLVGSAVQTRCRTTSRRQICLFLWLAAVISFCLTYSAPATTVFCFSSTRSPCTRAFMPLLSAGSVHPTLRHDFMSPYELQLKYGKLPVLLSVVTVILCLISQF